MTEDHTQQKSTETKKLKLSARRNETETKRFKKLFWNSLETVLKPLFQFHFDWSTIPGRLVRPSPVRVALISLIIY